MIKTLTLAAAALMLLAACSGQPGSIELRQIEDLTTRVAALEAQVASLEDMSGDHDTYAESGVFELAVAQYVMDTAGFHAMDEALHETGVVEPAYLSAVNRVAKVVGATTWPEERHVQVEAFQTVLTDFAAALEADDAATAAELAASAHEAQHDLSHSIDGTLSADGHDH